ncbi:7534_t:CDS:2, partial [Dentiscutata heterogama]
MIIGHRLGSIRKSELEKALHDSIKTVSDIANEYKDLDKINELNSFNHTLERERDDLNSKKHELEAEVGCKDSEITSLRTKVNELEKVAGKVLYSYGLISYLRSRVRELEDQLEQQISQSSHESNIIGGAKEDPDSAKSLFQETNTYLAEQVSKASSETNKVIGGALSFSSHRSKLEPDESKVKDVLIHKTFYCTLASSEMQKLITFDTSITDSSLHTMCTPKRHPDEVFNKLVSKPINLHPEYDLEYVKKYYVKCGSYNYNHVENMYKLEKRYDDLAIIRPCETPQQWVIRIKDDLKELLSRERHSIFYTHCLFSLFEQGSIRMYLKNHRLKIEHISYRRPKVHKSQIAICFKCWQLVKITKVEPKKVYWNRWHRWGYEIKSEDLMQNHWNNECSKTKMQDGSTQPCSLTPPPLPPKPFALIGGLSRYSCKHSIN